MLGSAVFEYKLYGIDMSKFTKILIVDDEPQSFEVIREVLQLYPSYEYLTATSGEQALELLEKFHPDIILLDVLMPGISGYEVCRRIRKDKNNHLAKIILISGLSKIGDKLKGYEVGADDYITKPFVEDELIAKLKVYSKLSRMEEVEHLKTTALNLLSHETRTPLNGIILGSELLSALPDQSVDAQRYIDMVRISAVRIQELVDKISRYCSLKDGIELTCSKGNLYEKLHAASKKVFKNSSSRLSLDFERSIECTADWSLFTAGVNYLFDYAAKKSIPDGVVRVRCNQSDQSITILIDFRGRSIDSVENEKIFDGLFIPNLLHHHEGSGLGLAIAKEAIEAHFGKLGCFIDDQRGTVFKIELKNPQLSIPT